MADFYETELTARLFDLQNADDPLLEKECAFFLEELETTDGPCLDLGCGTGRILVPALKDGIDIYGCDRSASFLGRTRQKARDLGLEIEDRLFLCDLANPGLAPKPRDRGVFSTFPLDALAQNTGNSEGFNLALAAFRTFDHLSEEGEREDFLRSMRSLLRPGGRLLINVANPTVDDLESAMGEKVLLRDDMEDPETGYRVAWWGATHFEPSSMLIQQAYIYDFLAPGGRVVETYHFPLTMRWTPGEEMRELAETAGFEVRNRWGGFMREPYERGTGDAVWELAAAE
ncbi:MAG: class I SAM-dependent methyltransferase [Candidatus Sumerlaeota bacterium]